MPITTFVEKSVQKLTGRQQLQMGGDESWRGEFNRQARRRNTFRYSSQHFLKKKQTEEKAKVVADVWGRT